MIEVTMSGAEFLEMRETMTDAVRQLEEITTWIERYILPTYNDENTSCTYCFGVPADYERLPHYMEQHLQEAIMNQVRGWDQKTFEAWCASKRIHFDLSDRRWWEWENTHSVSPLDRDPELLARYEAWEDAQKSKEQSAEEEDELDG